jgi:hypothetical protein
MDFFVFSVVGLVFFGVWGYAIHKLGLLLGITVGWIPAGIAAGVTFLVLALSLELLP